MTDYRDLVDADALAAAHAKHDAVLARLPRAESLLAAAHEAAKSAEAEYQRALSGESEADVFALSQALSTAADRVQIAEDHVAAVQKAIEWSHVQLDHDVKQARLPVLVAAARARLLVARKIDTARRALAAADAEAAELHHVFSFAGFGAHIWSGAPQSFHEELPFWRAHANAIPGMGEMLDEVATDTGDQK
jgi:hypothetical protein